MKRLGILRVILALCLVVPTGRYAAAEVKLPDSAFVPNEILIGLRPDAGTQLPPGSKRAQTFGLASLDELNLRFKVREIVRVFGTSKDADPVAERNGLGQVFKLVASPGVDIFKMIDQYAEDPNVEYAEPNRIYVANKTPSDNGYKNQWGLHNSGQSGGVKDADIDAPEAWDLAQGSDSVIIAIIDTGVDYKHPDLGGGRVLTDLDHDFINNDDDAMDDHGHGTYVSGIAAATSNNKVGMTGVCWKCRILPVKVLNSEGKGSAESVAQGIEYAASQGARILNMSLSYESDCGCSKTIARAINAAYERGSLLIAAAGNDSDKTRIGYPASSSRVLAVGATDRKDKEADFSNRDSRLDIMAPGKDIFSLDLSSKKKKYTTASGTSAATPFVAGTAGLIWSMRSDLSNGQVWQTLLNSRDSLSRQTPGRVNARNALGNIATSGASAPVDDCSDEPNCPVGCAAEVTLGGTGTFLESIETLHHFRDRVLASTSLGRSWIELYERHRMEVALIFLTNAELRAKTRQALLGWLPLMRAAAQGSRTPVRISGEQIRSARETILALMENGSDSLQSDLVSVTDVLNTRFLISGKDHHQLVRELRNP